MVFTLGHEYGHILLGHLEGAQTKKASGLAEAEIFVRSPEQEFKADEVGFRFAVLWSRATHKADLPGLLGIALSLHVGRLLQAFQAQDGESGSAEIAERYARFKQWTRDEKVPEEPLVDDLERFVSLTIDTGTAYLRETAS